MRQRLTPQGQFQGFLENLLFYTVHYTLTHAQHRRYVAAPEQGKNACVQVAIGLRIALIESRAPSLKISSRQHL